MTGARQEKRLNSHVPRVRVRTEAADSSLFLGARTLRKPHRQTWLVNGQWSMYVHMAVSSKPRHYQV